MQERLLATDAPANGRQRHLVAADSGVIQRQGARTALVTTHGFRDVLEIARGNRPETFNLRYQRDPCLVPRQHRCEVRERIAGDGSVITPLQEDEVAALVPRLRAAGIKAVAVSFLRLAEGLGMRPSVLRLAHCHLQVYEAARARPR